MTGAPIPTSQVEEPARGTPRRLAASRQRACGGPIYHSLHLLFDLAAVMVAWRATLELRLLLNPYMAITITRARMDVVAPRLSWLVALWILAALWMRTYRDAHDRAVVAGLLRVTESAVVVSTLAIVLTFFSRHLGADLSRSFVLLFAPISFLFLVGSFYSAMSAAQTVERRWCAPKRVAVLGAGPAAESLAQVICRDIDHQVSLRGLILPESAGPFDRRAANLPVLGTTRELAEVINRECLDRIIVACDTLTAPEYEYCGKVTRRMGVTISRPLVEPDPDVVVSYQMQYGLHLIDVQPVPFRRWEEVLKRVIDVLGSLMLITILLPIFALIACAIRLTSDGPVFYVSRRVGKGGRYFTFWKFRTMYVSGLKRDTLLRQNEKSGHLFKIRHDPRITPVGRVLRRLSFDELPQLFNVLAGEMSLVGPRPLPVEDLDPDGMSANFTRWAEERSRVRPGITGLWQVLGRSELSFARMVELDLEYIGRWSVGYDLRILLRTPQAVITGRGAY